MGVLMVRPRSWGRRRLARVIFAVGGEEWSMRKENGFIICDWDRVGWD